MKGLISITGFLLLAFYPLCLRADNSTNDDISYSPKGDETWIALEKSIKGIIERLIKEYLPMLMRMREETQISRPCSASLTKLLFGIRGMKLWALKMLDAAAKPTPGILMGSISAMGSYRECVAIESDGRKPFQGQYCTIELLPALPKKPEYVPTYNHDIIMKDNSPDISLAKRLQSLNSIFYVAKASLGLCIPSTCTKNDLMEMAKSVTSSLHMEANVASCNVKKEVEFTREQIVVIVILLLLAVLVVIGTIMDTVFQLRSLSSEEHRRKFQRMIVAFSLHSNMQKLFSSTSIKICSPLHGIHVISILWIILGMTYRTYHVQYMQYAFSLEEENRKLLFETIYSARTAFNTLYLLSGLLTSYLILKNKEQKRFNSFASILVRYLRLTPLVLFSLGFIILSPLFDSGPLWEIAVEKRAQTCQKSWWTYILYFSNWIKYEDMCTAAFQYASSVFQLHILALIVITILYRYFKIGVIFLLALASASVLSIAVLTYEYRLFPTVTKFYEEGFQKALFEKSSLQPYTHLGPYIVGLYVGYVLAKHSTASVKAIFQIIGWVLSTCICLAVVYYPFYSHRRNEPDATETTILSAIFRIGWAASLGWVIFACATGRAGVINRFLSCSVFVSLSRLSHLALFLLEYVIRIRFGQREQTLIYSHYNMAYEVFGHVFTVLLISLVGYALVDAPISNILQLFVNDPSRQNADLKKEVKLEPQKIQLKTVMVHSME